MRPRLRVVPAWALVFKNQPRRRDQCWHWEHYAFQLFLWSLRLFYRGGLDCSAQGSPRGAAHIWVSSIFRCSKSIITSFLLVIREDGVGTWAWEKASRFCLYLEQRFWCQDNPGSLTTVCFLPSHTWLNHQLHPFGWEKAIWEGAFSLYAEPSLNWHLTSLHKKIHLSAKK